MPQSLQRTEWQILVNAKTERRIPDNDDAGRIAAMFGLPEGRFESFYDNFELTVRPGEIVAIVGPSGAGKSLLLQHIAKQTPQAVEIELSDLSRIDSPAVAVLEGGSLGDRLEVLSRCGLAEATAMVAYPRDLSGGQLYRLALARALHAARRKGSPAMVIADEFASCLDRLTGTMLCRQMKKLLAGTGVALVLATPRAELLASLQASRVIVKALGDPPSVHESPAAAAVRAGVRWQPRITTGSIADYVALSRFHYLAGPPAAHKRVYVIRGPKAALEGWPEVAAVLVISPPVASVRGRNLATGGRYTGGDRTAAMKLLNEELECISRVVVHPMFRGCGLAVKLVRRAIAAAETPMVEALAAMGAVHPFFEKAGMTAYRLGPDTHTARLISAAEVVGLNSSDLAAVAPVRRVLAGKRTKASHFLKAELDIAAKRTFPAAQLARLTDPIGELCRRTARQYVYYLAS